MWKKTAIDNDPAQGSFGIPTRPDEQCRLLRGLSDVFEAATDAQAQDHSLEALPGLLSRDFPVSLLLCWRGVESASRLVTLGFLPTSCTIRNYHRYLKEIHTFCSQKIRSTEYHRQQLPMNGNCPGNEVSGRHQKRRENKYQVRHTFAIFSILCLTWTPVAIHSSTDLARWSQSWISFFIRSLSGVFRLRSSSCWKRCRLPSDKDMAREAGSIWQTSLRNSVFVSIFEPQSTSVFI